MDISQKSELTASIRHIVRILESSIPIYNSQVPGMAEFFSIDILLHMH